MMMKLTVLTFLLLFFSTSCSKEIENKVASPHPDTHSKPADSTMTKAPDSLDEMNDCRNDNECIIVDGGCGNPLTINNKYLKAAQPHLLGIYASVDCAAPSPPINPAIATCQANTCQILQ